MSDLWSLAVAERDAVEEDRRRGETVREECGWSDRCVVAGLEQQGRVEGESSVFLLGSRNAVSQLTQSVD